MAEIDVERVHQTSNDLYGGARVRRRDVSWGAIIAGVLIALATMTTLSLIGAAFRLFALTPDLDPATYQGVGIGAAIWYTLSKLFSLFIGGFAAARLSANLDSGRALLHGAAVWALAATASLWLVASGVGSLVGGAGSVLGSLAGGTANVVNAVVPDDIDLPNFDSSDVALDALPPRLQRAIREQGLTADEIKAQVRTAFRDVVSREEQRRARSIATDAAVDMVRSPGDIGEDFDAAVDRLVGRGGVISAEDRAELRVALESRLGISAEEAEAALQSWEAEAREAAAGVRETARELRADALDAADATTDALAQAALCAALALLLGLGAALAGAGTGRRDEPLYVG